jgi:hypothetical protein
MLFAVRIPRIMLAALAVLCVSLSPAPAATGPSAAGASAVPAPSLDELIAKARAASGAPYAYRIVSHTRESAGGHTYDVTSETQGVKYVARRCERGVCSGFYFDGEHSFNTNINDTALPTSPLVDGLQLTLRAISSYTFASPDFRANGGALTFRGAVLRGGKRCWRIGVAPSRGALLDAVLDAETGLVVGVISDERRVAFEFRDQRRVGKITIPFDISLDGKRVEKFDDRSIEPGDLNVPTGLVPTFAATSTALKFSGPGGSAVPIVPCTIGGQSVSCLLDTGNSGLSMSLELAEKLGIEPTGSFEVKGVGEYTTGIAKAPELTIGDATYPSAKYVVLHDMHAYGYDVVLGADAFARAKITIDYPARTVSLAPTPAAGDGLPAVYADFIPVLAVRLGSLEAPLQVDTGDESTINLAYDFYQSHPAIFKTTGTTGVAGIGGGSEQITGEIASVRVGDATLTHQKIGATKALQSAAAGHLGSGFLAHFSVTFDYAHGTIALVPKVGDAAFAR